MKDTNSFQSLFKQIRELKSDLWLTNLYGVLATLLLLPVPLLFPLLIDEVLLQHPGKMTAVISRLSGSSSAWLPILVIAVTVLSLRLLAFLLNNRKIFYSIRLTEQVSYRLRDRILRHLERVSLARYETLKSGGVASKTVQDVEAISHFAGEVVTSLVSALLMVTGVALIMLKMNWVLALLVFFLNPLFLGFSRILGRKTAELWRRQHEAYELYHELLNETLELFIQVRASNQERSFFGLLRSRARDIETASLDYGYRASVAHSSSNLLTSGVVDLFRALGIGAVAYSDLSIGMMIAFLFYLSTLVAPIQQLMGLVIGYQTVRPGLARINSLLSLEQEPQYPREANPFANTITVPIELKGVSFSYAKGKEVLHDISLKAGVGQKVALVGPSGSGKTTIAQLMVGFYPPSSGEIAYGGVPIEKIGLPVVRESVALMLQETLFFNDTIRMNLTLSREESDEVIYAALKAAQLDKFVRGLDAGLDSRIGKNGIRLSGGQRQRLAIARLILSNPKVVIFDEATSSLDNRTEFQLYETLAPFLQGRTVIIIAHRATTIRQADYIYLVEEGRVSGEGGYEELYARKLIKEDFDLG